MKIIGGTRRVKTVVQRSMGQGRNVNEVTVRYARKPERPPQTAAHVSGKRTTLGDLMEAAWERREARRKELE
jgi:hypothetical protein